MHIHTAAGDFHGVVAAAIVHEDDLVHDALLEDFGSCAARSLRRYRRALPPPLFLSRYMGGMESEYPVKELKC